MKHKIAMMNLNPLYLPNIEHELSKQASKGWLVDEAFEFAMKFKKSKPQNLEFNIIHGPNYSKENLCQDELNDYKILCGQSGWEFHTRFRDYSIFSTDDLDRIPLHFESIGHISNVKRKINQFRRGNLAFILLTLLLLYLFAGVK